MTTYDEWKTTPPDDGVACYFCQTDVATEAISWLHKIRWVCMKCLCEHERQQEYEYQDRDDG